VDRRIRCSSIERDIFEQREWGMEEKAAEGAWTPDVSAVPAEKLSTGRNPANVEPLWKN
jgi:hypothetical protein